MNKGVYEHRITGIAANEYNDIELSGFSVLKVKAKGHRDLVTVVGSLASVSAGEWLTAQGHWVQDREFSPQDCGRGLPRRVRGQGVRRPTRSPESR